MEKHILYFQTEQSAEEAKERLCLLDWQSFDLRSLEPWKHGGQSALVLRSTDQLADTACDSLCAMARPDVCIWNLDAWADAFYQHAFYYSTQDRAQDAQDDIHRDTAVLAWSKVITTSDQRYKVLFGTKLPLTEREQRLWTVTFDPEEFEFNKHLREREK